MNITRATTILLALLAPLAASAHAGDVPGIDPRIDGLGMVRLVDDPNVTILDFLETFNATHPLTPAADIGEIPGRRIHRLEFDLTGVPPDQIDTVLDALEAEWETQLPAGVRWIELEYEDQAPEGKTGSVWVTQLVDEGVFRDQFTVETLGMAAAQQRSTGAGVTVAVLDTGIDVAHPVLAGRVLPTGFNFADGTTDTSDSGNQADDDGDDDVDEMTGHGTYVAGLIAITAPDARLLPVVVLNDDGVGDLWSLAQGLFFAIDRGVEVINLSLSSTYRSDAVEDAIMEAAERGVVVVAAAGNFDRNDPRENPATQDFVLGVAAVDDLDVKGSFSNFHDDLLISAPGATFFVNGDPQQPDPARSIVSTLPDGGFAIWEGTSFATSLVSGAAALVRAQQPMAPLDLTTYFLVRDALLLTAVDIDPINPAYAGEMGYGRVNVAAAVDLGPVAPGPGDVNNDGAVDVLDLVEVITSWGPCPAPPDPCPADADGDGQVAVGDLLVVILSWAP
jgi:subtilisin family serine protease